MLTNNVAVGKYTYRSAVATIIELALWLAPTWWFLWLFVRESGGAISGAALHFQFVSLIALLNWSLRYVGARWLHRRVYEIFLWILSILTGTAFLLVLIYQIVVILGLREWGSVVTLPLLTTYARQLDVLAETLGTSPWLAAAAVVLLLTITIASFKTLANASMRPIIVRQADSRLSPLAVLVISLVALYELISTHFIFADSAHGAPIALTLRPPATKLQSYSIQYNQHLIVAEDRVRESYKHRDLAARPNVILIVVDALRPDHLEINGYERRTTPYLHHLLRSPNSANFGAIRAICSESFCGLQGIISSRYVHQFVPAPYSLADALRVHGYSINMVLAGDHTSFYGLREAYGQVDYYFDGSMADRRSVNSDAALLDALDRLKVNSTLPTFIQFHLMSVHSLSRRGIGGAPFQPARSIYSMPAFGPTVRYTEAEHQALINNYDNGVLDADHVIGLLLQRLEVKGLLRNALVVVTADHGELLGEHGYYGHAKTTLEGVLRVPLIIKKYGSWGGSELGPFNERWGSQIDIAPTIAHEIGLPLPASWVGTPLHASFESQRKTRLLFFQQGSSIGLLDLANFPEVFKYTQNLQHNTQNLLLLKENNNDEGHALSLTASFGTRAYGWNAALAEMKRMIRSSAALNQ